MCRRPRSVRQRIRPSHRTKQFRSQNKWRTGVWSVLRHSPSWGGGVRTAIPRPCAWQTPCHAPTRCPRRERPLTGIAQRRPGQLLLSCLILRSPLWTTVAGSAQAAARGGGRVATLPPTCAASPRLAPVRHAILNDGRLLSRHGGRRRGSTLKFVNRRAGRCCGNARKLTTC